MRKGEVVAERFEIVQWVARGGMADVHRAIDRLTGDAVALKVLHVASPDHLARFAREAEVLARLEHPAVVRHVAHGALWTGDAFLVMEWLDGRTLADELSRRSLTVGESLDVVGSVAAGLGRAHELGIFHRDITPRNIMLTDDAEHPVKLLDFGLVRAREQAGWVTDTGATVGTAGYVSPEQLVGEGPIDARTDVFALGCVLYECLGGRAAFSSTDLTAALGETLFDEPPSLEHVAPDVPSPVRALVERMLSKDRAGRPPHGAAVAEEIGRLQAEIRERS